MESGFGQNLEGFLIKGNLSLAPGELPYLQGDGSIEGSGTLYINRITEYDLNNGLNIQNIIIKDNCIYVPYEAPSTNVTTASFVIEGGISVKNTTNASSVTSGGGITVAGGVGIGKNLYVGGQVDVSENRIVRVSLPTHGQDAANKDYVDSVANKLSGNFTTGQVIIAENNGTAIRGYDNFTFDGFTLLVDAPLIITNTSPSESTTSGGLVVYGGVGIVGDVNLGGSLDLGSNVISNVGYPVNNNDVATKQYVDDHKLSGNFTTGQLIVAASISDEIRGYENLTYDGHTILLSSTSNATGSIGGAFVCYGGISISKDVFIGGILDVNNNNIKNVAEPTEASHAATKQYVDSKTYGNLLGNFENQQVVIATSDPSSLTGYRNFLYNGLQLSLGTNGNFVIYNTTNTSSLLDSTTFTTYGGANIYKNLIVGGTLDVKNNNVINVATPVNTKDAANKEYVDSVANKLSGNFTTGQVIIAETNGTAIRGFDNITFVKDSTSSALLLSKDTSLFILNTTNASGHGTGGSFTTLGGGSFGKDVYIGGTTYVNYKNIKEVEDPIDNYDAVNKHYVDELIASLSQSVYGNAYTLQNATTDDIPNFYFPSQVKAFVSNVFVKRDNTDCAVFTIYGSHNGSKWVINTSYIGDSTGVTFGVRTSSGAAYIQYTNTNTTGVSSVRYKTSTKIDTLESSQQVNFTLAGNVAIPQSIVGLEYANSVFNSIQFIAHISSETDDKYTLLIVNIVKTSDNHWKKHVIALGDNVGVVLSLFETTSDTIQLQYINPNIANDYTLRIKKIDIKTSDTQIVLAANTLLSSPVTNTKLHYANTDYVFNVIIHVSVPDLDKYAMYHICGLYCAENGWRINSRYIGDCTGVHFQIKTESGVGKLSYTNKNNCNAYIRFFNSPPFAIEPLPVEKGGTGRDYLLPYAVLRGDGTNPIVGTDDFIYKDYQLVLGSLSSIVLNNTTNATSVTSGGTFTTNGGGSFGKDVYIGGTTYVSYKNIKEVADPIVDYDAANKKYVDFIDITSDRNDDRIEYTLNLSNNVTDAIDIPNLSFSSDIRAFITNIHVEYNNQVCGLYSIHGIKTGSSWAISSILTGHQTGVGFEVRTNNSNGDGILQYTNANKEGTTYIRYRTIIQVDNLPSSISQTNYNLLPNVVLRDITPLTFNNSEMDSIKLIIYVSSETDDRYGMFLANCVLKGNAWFMNTHSIGNVTGIKFNINTVGSIGKVQYSNSNTSSDYVIRIKKYEIPTSLTEVKLEHNTLSPAIIDNSELAFPDSDNYFQISVFVYVPDLSKYALFEIRGVFCNGMWTSNSRYIGDCTGIKFFVTGSNNHGKLSFTNSNATQDAFIRFIKHAPLASLKPLAINKGGTASSYLNPYAVLRGNGVNPIIGTNDFIYKDYQLVLGDMSSIVLQNTNANTFVVFGGISIDKDVTIGERLIVNECDVTPNEKDINAEKSFAAANNQMSPQNVNGFNFGTTTKSFSGIICVTITTSTDMYDSLFEIKGLKRSSGTWLLDYTYIGDNTGVDFNISSTGQIQYTSSNMPNWISTVMKFRAITTTV